MMAGRRINLASLANNSVLEPATSATAVAVEAVAANPLNPRGDLGDLTKLIQSMESVGQLQPCTAVTKLAYLAVYPEHREHIGNADYVVVMGGRRLAAAKESSTITQIDISVKDQLAQSRETLAVAAVVENIERRDFDPIQETHAVQRLVEIVGKKQDVATRLARSNGWVTQRLSLLNLSPDLRPLVRSGKLPVRDARELAKLPSSEQTAEWERQSEPGFFTAVKKPGAQVSASDTSGKLPEEDGEFFYRGKKTLRLSRAMKLLGETPDDIAQTLRSHLTGDECRLVAKLLVVDTQ